MKRETLFGTGLLLLVFSFAAPFLISCTMPKDDLLTAIKRYTVNGRSIEQHVKDRVGRLKAEGKQAESTWRTEQVNERQYTIIAEVGFGQPFVWDLTKKGELGGMLDKENVWRLKPKNKTARSIMH